MGRRRKHGEGTIYQRADGRWCAQLTLDDGKRKTLYGTTSADVQRKLTAAKRDRDLGISAMGERQTVAHYLASWLEVQTHRLDVGTLTRYEQDVRLHIVPALGRLQLARLTPQQVQALYAAKLAQGLSPRTVGHTHVVLKSALKSAVRLGLVQSNVCDRVDPPRAARPQMHPLTATQANAFLEAAAHNRLYALFVLAIQTGMREGELLGLTWENVDLDNGFVHVQSSLQRVPGHKRIKQPKTAHSRRRIALTPHAVEAMRTHRMLQREQRLRVGECWRDQGLVFPGRNGGMANKSSVVDHHFKRILQLSGCPNIRFHDLRHTAATLLLLQSVHPKIVSEMLGHASVSITLDLYSHVLPDMQRDAATAMARVFAR
jgi:integrase